ncbi:unnamed protein product, partial [Prorocentrum cordatum]
AWRHPLSRPPFTRRLTRLPEMPLGGSSTRRCPWGRAPACRSTSAAAWGGCGISTGTCPSAAGMCRTCCYLVTRLPDESFPDRGSVLPGGRPRQPRRRRGERGAALQGRQPRRGARLRRPRPRPAGGHGAPARALRGDQLRLRRGLGGDCAGGRRRHLLGPGARRPLREVRHHRGPLLSRVQRRTGGGGRLVRPLRRRVRRRGERPGAGGHGLRLLLRALRVGAARRGLPLLGRHAPPVAAPGRARAGPRRLRGEPAAGRAGPGPRVPEARAAPPQGARPWPPAAARRGRAA